MILTIDSPDIIAVILLGTIFLIWIMIFAAIFWAYMDFITNVFSPRFCTWLRRHLNDKN